MLLIITFIHKNAYVEICLVQQKVCIVVALFGPHDILGLPCIENGEISSGEGWLQLGRHRRESGNSKT